ncbi:MAG: epoxyqueuosine reductase QueH [Clostridia bacterium]|nr:epoxyqueuosine reductase QueH [Clostridia bacterium]
MKINYQQLLENELARVERENTVPRLLLHACCAPCSSYVLEYLTKYFDITVYFYNPNITDYSEYMKRADELKRLISIMPHDKKIDLIVCDHAPTCFYELSRGLEALPEGGVRCFACYRERLEATAKYMSEHSGEYDYFATTLTVSPHKNAAKLNEIGAELSETYGIRYLPSDFKKREGYKRSIELSREYGLYRQDFCGCEFSRDFKYGNS